MGALFNKWNDILDKEMLTENEIINLKARLTTSPNSLNNTEVDNLKYKLDNKNYQITPEQTEKGIEYLNRKIFKQNGQRRNTKQVKDVCDETCKIIKDFMYFEFVGFASVGNNMMCEFYSPMYRTYDHHGNFFDYHMDQMLNFVIDYIDYDSPYDYEDNENEDDAEYNQRMLDEYDDENDDENKPPELALIQGGVKFTKEDKKNFESMRNGISKWRENLKEVM